MSLRTMRFSFVQLSDQELHVRLYLFGFVCPSLFLLLLPLRRYFLSEKRVVYVFCEFVRSVTLKTYFCFIKITSRKSITLFGLLKSQQTMWCTRVEVSIRSMRNADFFIFFFFSFLKLSRVFLFSLLTSHVIKMVTIQWSRIKNLVYDR